MKLKTEFSGISFIPGVLAIVVFLTGWFYQIQKGYRPLDGDALLPSFIAAVFIGCMAAFCRGGKE